MQRKVTIYNFSKNTLDIIKEMVLEYPHFHKYFGKDFVKNKKTRKTNLVLDLMGKKSLYFKDIDLQCPSEVELILNQTQATILYYMLVDQAYYYLRTRFVASIIEISA